MLNKSSESAQVEEGSSHWNLFEAIELVERQFGLCSNKKMPKSTVSFNAREKYEQDSFVYL